MGKTFAMQPWVTMKGASIYTDDLIQPTTGWVNGENFKEAVVDFAVVGNTVASGTMSLILETSVSPGEPWTSIATISDAYCRTTKYFTSREGGTSKFDRFLRWKLDPSSAGGDWTITFKICTTLK